MKKFFYKSFVFFVLISTTVSALSFTYKKIFSRKSDYMASIIDKHKRLAQIDSNRLLLVGGSNLAFGIDSKMIEQNFDVNVINMGIHAGLGLEFMINEAITSVKSGDVVLLSIEYSLYDQSTKPSIDLINHMQIIYPLSKDFYHIGAKDNFYVFLQNANKRFNRQQIEINTTYDRRSFNKFGDAIGHLNQDRPVELKDKGIIKKIDIGSNALLFRELYNKCNSIGAKLYIVFPTYPVSEFNLNKKNIYDLKEQIKSQIDFIELINDPETFVYDDSFFFDTVFHLNAHGRNVRTKKLIEILRSRVYNTN